MMKDWENTYDLYMPMPAYTIVEFISNAQNSKMPCNQVVLRQMNTGEITKVNVSFCAILIGFRPNLHFLNPMMRSNDTNDSPSIDDKLKDSQMLTSPTYNLLSRKITWLKNLCAKCKHLNLCDRNRRMDATNNRKLCSMHQTSNRDTCHSIDITRSKQNNDNNNNTINCIFDKYEYDDSNQFIHDNNNNNSHNNNHHNNSDTNNSHKSIVTETNSVLTLRIGEDMTKPIDCKTNPIAVDKFTNEVLHVPTKGLYAMGPLVGDNFIRFIPGGALAITAALQKQHR